MAVFRRKMFKSGHRSCLKYISLTVAVTVAVSAVLFVDKSVEQMSRSISIMTAEELIYKAVNSAVENQLSRQNLSYYDIISTKSENGSIAAVTANTAAINLLKSTITLDAEKSLEKYKNLKISVQLGSVTGSAFLSNRGPQVNLYYDFYSTINSVFCDEFVAAGLNQTKHILKLVVLAKYCLVVVDEEFDDTITTEYIVAQNIISGDVPTAYGRIYGLDSGANGTATVS